MWLFFFFFLGYEVLDFYVVYSPTHGEREIIVHAIMLRWTPSEVWSSFAGRWCNNLPCTCDSLHTQSVSRMYIRVPISIYVKAIVSPTTISRENFFGRKHGDSTDLQPLQHGLLVAVLFFQRQLRKLQFHDLTGLDGLGLSTIGLQ